VVLDRDLAATLEITTLLQYFHGILITAELNGLLEASRLTTCAVWGYRHRELVPHELQLSNGRVSETEAADYSGMLVLQLKS